ncbi:NADH-quinone oxidoreductase subunit L [Thermithiobacillus tepidarius DSM 3134]|uniref:NADH-quinone oxidoreductase subunit L n=1 Tax=Thermithiobacillus tepidarius TaxID=929 RepID=UPI00042744CD|nr:NADH-quinone oxidoreductase subunit L [Thermithiobacillus tepidarius]
MTMPVIFEWLYQFPMRAIYLAIPLAPLLGALVAGLFGWKLKEKAHWAAVPGVAVAFFLAVFVLFDVLAGNTFYGDVYTWGMVGDVSAHVGFQIDRLSAMMMVVVTFVSLCVHIYTIGYMHGDPGYARFFSYIALFTFSMLMLVMSNNFLQLFFGWEAVGLVSYLLIGFWFTRESAIYANLKAFLVNRVGDFGFLIGIAAIYKYFGTLDYATVFARVGELAQTTVQIIPGYEWSLMTWIALMLFIGAMGKSAQVPLHVWLPDSMEGPTPISALIHAATMVTAGIFMVARMSPIYELSTTALSVVMVIGAITALSMALVGLVQNDIKRVVAYSTLSQLGYMTTALGASAYAAGVFHLMTHAFFKALLFLAAGSVIHAMHHEQDIRKMGGLRKYMPITYVTSIIGSLALAGIPPFAGFFSKDAIIEAVELSHTPGAAFAYFALVVGVFLTAFYSFRMFFLVFHGQPRMDEHTRHHLHESPWVITVPLVILAVPSALAGLLYIEPMLFGPYFADAIRVLPEHDVLGHLAEEWHGVLPFILHGLQTPTLWLAVAGIGLSAFFYLVRPDWPAAIASAFRPVYVMLDRKYWADEFNNLVFAKGALGIGRLFWKVGDVKLIDGSLVNGTANLVGRIALLLRQVQTGYIYHYAFAMIIGLFALMTYFLIIQG